MTIYRLDETPGLTAPVLVAALDGWVDAGTAATTAAERLAEGGSVIATFDGDLLFDYRARRPTLEIIDGRLTELTWPAVRLQRARIAERDLLDPQRRRAGLPLDRLLGSGHRARQAARA